MATVLCVCALAPAAAANGITWAAHEAAEQNTWYAVTHGGPTGQEQFVAVSFDGTNRVVTIPDGITWTYGPPAEQICWNSITYGNGRFVALALDGPNRVTTSTITPAPPTAVTPAYTG